MALLIVIPLKIRNAGRWAMPIHKMFFIEYLLRILRWLLPIRPVQNSQQMLDFDPCATPKPRMLHHFSGVDTEDVVVAPTQPLRSLRGDGCWQLLFPELPDDGIKGLLSITKELARGLASTHKLATGRFNMTTYQGISHIEPGQMYTAAEVIKFMGHRLGASQQSFVNAMVTETVSDFWCRGQRLCQTEVWREMSMQHPPRCLQDCATIAHLSHVYCWLPVVYITPDQALEDILEYGPMMVWSMVRALVAERNLQHRKVKLYQSQAGGHIEVDDTGVDFSTLSLKRDSTHLPTSVITRPYSWYGAAPTLPGWTVTDITFGQFSRGEYHEVDYLDDATILM